MGSRYSAVTFVTATIAGASIWVVSPWLTGRAEPWDADGPFYVCGLVVAGLTSGALRSRPLWAHYAGAVAGQLTYEVLFLPVGPLILLGAILVMGCSSVFLAAAALGGLLRQRLTRG